MKKLLVTAMMAIVTVSAYAEDNPPTFKAEEIQPALEDHLKDAYSARFRKIRYFDNSGDVWMICGEVSSKNSYGAYVGYTPFRGIAIKDGKNTEYTITAVGEFAC